MKTGLSCKVATLPLDDIFKMPLIDSCLKTLTSYSETRVAHAFLLLWSQLVSITLSKTGLAVV